MLIKKRTIERVQTTWANLKVAAETGAISELIQNGDLIPFTLKTGEEVAVRATPVGGAVLSG